MTENETVGDREIIAQRFQLEAQVHRGTMARVLSARDISNGDRVAVKLPVDVREANLRRFAFEGELLSQLRHPGIVRYIAHGGEGPRRISRWSGSMARHFRGVSSSGRSDRPKPLRSPDDSARRSPPYTPRASPIGISSRPIFSSAKQFRKRRLIDFGIARREKADTHLKPTRRSMAGRGPTCHQNK